MKYGESTHLIVDGNRMTGSWDGAGSGYPATYSLLKHKSVVVVMSPRYSRAWKGATKCEADQVFPAMETPVVVSAIDNALVVTRGIGDQPGSFTVRGTPEDRGGLQLFGIGISGMPQHRGEAIPVQFDGNFEGDRYQGLGLFGKRKCVLSIWPADQ